MLEREIYRNPRKLFTGCYVKYRKVCEVCEELDTPMPEYILLGDDVTVKLSALESASISDSKISRC